MKLIEFCLTSDKELVAINPEKVVKVMSYGANATSIYLENTGLTTVVGEYNDVCSLLAADSHFIAVAKG